MYTSLKRLIQLKRNCAVAICVLITGGCATVGAPPQTETLGAVAELNLRSDGIRAWRLADAELYEEACIRPDRIELGVEVALDETEARLLRSELADALRASFVESGMQVCELPGRAPSLTVRAAITTVERAKPTVNAITTLLLLAPLSHGGITVELEAVDAKTGHRVAAMAFRGRAGVADVGSAFSELGHASKQLRIAAARFAEVVTASPVRDPAPPPSGSAFRQPSPTPTNAESCRVVPARLEACLPH